MVQKQSGNLSDTDRESISVIAEPYQPKDARGRDDAERIVWIERTVLVLLFLGLLAFVLEVLRPFGTAILFGAALATAAWPLRQVLVRRGLGHGTAATLLLLGSLALLVVPVLVVAPSIAEQVSQGIERARSYFAVQGRVGRSRCRILLP
jgi:predicted PurR-regulated permease PerM